MYQYDNGGYQQYTGPGGTEKASYQRQTSDVRPGDAYYHPVNHQVNHRRSGSTGTNRYSAHTSQNTSSSRSKSYDNDSVFDGSDHNHNTYAARGTMQHHPSSSSGKPGTYTNGTGVRGRAGYPTTRELSPTSTRYIKGEREIPPSGESPPKGFNIRGYPRLSQRDVPSYELQRIPRAVVGANPDLLEGSRGVMDRDREDGDQSTLSSGRDPNKSTGSSRDELDMNRNIPSRDPSPEHKGRRSESYLRHRTSADPGKGTSNSPRDGTAQSVLSSSGSNEDANTRGLLAQKALMDTNPDLSRLDPNRSIMSGEYRVNRPVSSGQLTLYSSAILDANRSSGLRDYCPDQTGMGSLKRDPVTHRKIPTHQQNGTARHLRDLGPGTTSSRRSLSSSHYSLTRNPSRLTLYGRGFGIHNSLISLVALALLSLLLVAIGLQMVYRLNVRETTEGYFSESLLSSSAYTHVKEVCIGFSTFVVMLDLCCFFVCALQFFLAAKLVKCPQGNER